MLGEPYDTWAKQAEEDLAKAKLKREAIAKGLDEITVGARLTEAEMDEYRREWQRMYDAAGPDGDAKKTDALNDRQAERPPEMIRIRATRTPQKRPSLIEQAWIKTKMVLRNLLFEQRRQATVAPSASGGEPRLFWKIDLRKDPLLQSICREHGFEQSPARVLKKYLWNLENNYEQVAKELKTAGIPEDVYWKQTQTTCAALEAPMAKLHSDLIESRDRGQARAEHHHRNMTPAQRIEARAVEREWPEIRKGLLRHAKDMERGKYGSKELAKTIRERVAMSDRN